MKAVRDRIILDLCGGTGSWSKPYKDAGYDVRLVTLPDNDVRNYQPPKDVYGILAAPPCTEFAVSGARWWREKPLKLFEDAVEIVESCINIIVYQTKPKFWALENPVGRLKYVMENFGYRTKLIFNPCDYGDPWTKKTCLWGKFNFPKKAPVYPSEGSKLHRLPPSKDRQKLRSITAPGFAKAFFEANQ